MSLNFDDFQKQEVKFDIYELKKAYKEIIKYKDIILSNFPLLFLGIATSISNIGIYFSDSKFDLTFIFLIFAACGTQKKAIVDPLVGVYDMTVFEVTQIGDIPLKLIIKKDNGGYVYDDCFVFRYAEHYLDQSSAC